MSAADELKRLEREIERRAKGTTEPKAQGPGAPPRLPAASGKPPRDSFDLILVLAAGLVIMGIAVNTVRKMPDEQAKSLRDGMIGGAAGLAAGYAVGRLRP
jgi:hypothetical protein